MKNLAASSLFHAINHVNKLGRIQRGVPQKRLAREGNLFLTEVVFRSLCENPNHGADVQLSSTPAPVGYVRFCVEVIVIGS